MTQYSQTLPRFRLPVDSQCSVYRSRYSWLPRVSFSLNISTNLSVNTVARRRGSSVLPGGCGRTTMPPSCQWWWCFQSDVLQNLYISVDPFRRCTQIDRLLKYRPNIFVSERRVVAWVSKQRPPYSTRRNFTRRDLLGVRLSPELPLFGAEARGGVFRRRNTTLQRPYRLVFIERLHCQQTVGTHLLCADMSLIIHTRKQH